MSITYTGAVVRGLALITVLTYIGPMFIVEGGTAGTVLAVILLTGLMTETLLYILKD